MGVKLMNMSYCCWNKFIRSSFSVHLGWKDWDFTNTTRLHMWHFASELRNRNLRQATSHPQKWPPQKTKQFRLKTLRFRSFFGIEEQPVFKEKTQRCLSQRVIGRGWRCEGYVPLKQKSIYDLYMIYSTSSPRSGNILQSQTESGNGKKHRFFFFFFF